MLLEVEAEISGYSTNTHIKKLMEELATQKSLSRAPLHFQAPYFLGKI
jgi:hypothetical protein